MEMMMDRAFDWDTELEQLNDFLMSRITEEALAQSENEKIRAGIFNVYQLDGFFAALFTMPEFVSPGQWFEVLWGDFPPIFEDTRQAQETMGRIMRFYNAIGQMLQEGHYEPLWMSDEDEVREAYVTAVAEGGQEVPRTLMPLGFWFEGYMMAFDHFSPTTIGFLEVLDQKMEGEENDPLGDEDQRNVWSIAYPFNYGKRLMMQLIENGPIEGLGERSLAEKVLQVLEVLPEALYGAMTPTRDRMRERAEQPFVRVQPKVGRNDPCPCGSGKKYKKCCLQ